MQAGASDADAYNMRRAAARQALEMRKIKQQALDEATIAYQEMTSLLRTVQGMELDAEIQMEMEEEAKFDRWGMSMLGIPNFSVRFTLVIALFVCLNAITIGLETDYADSSESLTNALGALEHLYCIVFLIEMLIRIIVMRWKYFQNPWLLLDAGLVLLALFDTWVVPFLTVVNVSGIGNLSVLRLIRLLRLVRLVKLMRSCRELWLLVCGLVAGLKTLFWVAILMGLALYICAVLCVQTIGQDRTYPTGEDIEFSQDKFFENIPTGMLALWECLNDGCTADIVRPVVMHNKYLTVFFVAFVMVMVHGFLNILVGVFVDGTLESAQEQEMKIARQREMTHDNTLAKVRNVYNLFDKDGSATLTRQEFVAAFGDDQMQEILEGIGLDQVCLADLYNILDLNQDDCIEMSELVSGFMYLHNALKHPANSSYLVSVRILSLLRTTYQELTETYRSLAGQNAQVAFLPGQIACLTPPQPIVAEGHIESMPDETPPQATREPKKLNDGTDAQPKGQDEPQSEDKPSEGNGASPETTSASPETTSSSPSKSQRKKRHRPPALEKEEPTEEDYFGEIRAYPSGFDHLMDQSDKLDGRPFLLCFEPYQREDAYLQLLLPATLHWCRWTLALLMVSVFIMPFTEIFVVPESVLWVRFTYRMVVCTLFGIVVAFMTCTMEKWSLQISRHTFLGIIFGLHLFFSNLFRPRRVAAMLGATGEVQDLDAWWESLFVVYLALLSNFPGRMLIPLLLFAMAMTVVSATMLDAILLGGNQDSGGNQDTLEGVVPFVAIDGILLVYVFLWDRQKRFSFILQQRIQQHEDPDPGNTGSPETCFTPAGSFKSPGNGRGHCSVLPTA